MKVSHRLSILLSLILGSAMMTTAQTTTALLDAQKIAVVIAHKCSKGVLKLNGIPIHRFGENSPGDGDLQTDTVGTVALFATNGNAELMLETHPAGAGQDAYTDFRIIHSGSLEDMDKPPIFRKEIKGEASIRQSLNLRNVPHWAFHDLAPWTGDKQAAVAAVKELHKAYQNRDDKAVANLERAMFEDLRSVMGEAMGSYDEFLAQNREVMKSTRLDPLPSDLKVEAFYDNRLFVVTNADGRAPVRLVSNEKTEDGMPAQIVETGMYWIYRDGHWSVIRN